MLSIIKVRPRGNSNFSRFKQKSGPTREKCIFNILNPRLIIFKYLKEFQY